MSKIQIKRGTRAQVDAAASANGLLAGEPYLITDEERLAVGLGVSDYSALATETELNTKQATLVSGTNIKTVNSTSLLGSGNVAITENATHTGDVTGATALTIANDAVTNVKLANMATKTYKGRTSGTTGDPEDVAVATLKTDLGLVKADVGLGNVDNTSDANKPVSTATQTALNTKQDTLVSGTNIKTVNSTSLLGSGNVAITENATHTGDVTGATALTIANDAVTNVKLANMATKTYKGRTSGTTGDPEDVAVATLKTDLGLVKADVGLGNVDNTSDAAKPVSTDTQTALNTKQATLVSGTNIKTVNSTSLLGSGNVAITENATHTGDVTGATALTIANSAVTLAKMANLAQNTIIGRVTASTGVPEALTAANVRTVINVADGANAYTHPNHTGDVTSTGDGVTAIANDAVTNAKAANMAQATIKGRAVAAGTGDPTDLTPAEARAVLNVADGATANPGTVTSVAVSGSDGIEIDSGSPVTSSGTIALGVNAATLRTHINVENGANNYVHPAHTGDVTGATALTIANGAVTLAKQANMATASVVYRKTALAGPPEVQTLATLKTDLGLTGTNSGDQTSIVGITGTKAQFNTAASDGTFLYVGDVTSNATHTGDVTGATALTIANDAVTNVKLANMATKTYKGRTSGTTGDPEDVAVATLKTDLGLVKGDVGLGNVDNTSDANKPVSTATQTALNTKQDTLVSGTNIKTVNSTSLLGSGNVAITENATHTGDVTGSGALTIANGAVTLAKQANMATASVVYRKTAGAGAPEVQTLATLKADLGLTGTNSGDQTSIVGITGTKAQFNTAASDGTFLYVGDVTSNATHTGDVTGATALTIAANAVTNAKLADMATATIKGRVTALTGDPEDLTAAQVRTLLNVADGANAYTHPNHTGDVTSTGDGVTAIAAGVIVDVDINASAAIALSKLATDPLARANHTGSQAASTISDFSSAVASTAAVTANTAKVTNATHTGDVTGATALTIANDAVSNAKLADMAVNTIKGRITTGTGDPEDLTAANVRTIINVADGANNYTLPEATTTVRGGIELWSDTDQSVAANTVSTTAGRTYGLQLNAAGQGVVNVPWTNTVYTLPEATTTVRGGIELWSDTDQSVAANTVSTTADRTYGLQLNAAGQGVVNVPWVDTNTTYSVGDGLTSAGTVFSLGTPGSLTGATTNALTASSHTHAVSLTASDVGLGNVDNTSDANKPVSSATQTALNAKQATLVSGTNIKTVNSTSLLGSGNVAITENATHTGDVTGATALTIANGAVTLAKQANMATASVVYRKTALAGPPEVQTLATLKTDLGLTGTNSGDQTSIVGITGTKAQFNTAASDGTFLYVGDVTSNATHTGDVTGATALTIAANAVTNAKLADMAANTVKVRAAATSGDPSDVALAASQILGRGATGDVAPIVLGTNLSMTGTTLNATVGESGIDQLTGDVTAGPGSGSQVATISAGAVTLAKQANMATASVVYRKTAGAGAPEVQTLATLKTDLGLTGTNSGDQTSIVGITGTKAQFSTACSDGTFLYSGDVTSNATHTGDVTGATALTIAANAVTNAKAADMAVNTIKGRITTGTGDPEDLTAANVRTIINVADGANNYTLPEATTTVRGGIELWSDTDQSVAANTVSTTAGRTYGLQLNAAGQGVVNVPWVDTNTTYSVGDGLTSADTVFSLGTPGSLTGATTNALTASSHTHAVSLTASDVGAQVALSTVGQAEAEAGTATIDRIWTAQRVSQAITALGGGGGGGSGCEIFTASGTFTVPAGVTKVKVTVVGGGGAGATAGSTSTTGGGGGGGVAIGTYTVTPAAEITVTVGAGGDNANGGTSSFGAHCSATGGVKPANNATTGGAGGTATGGAINLSGGSGSRSNHSYSYFNESWYLLKHAGSGGGAGGHDGSVGTNVFTGTTSTNPTNSEIIGIGGAGLLGGAGASSVQRLNQDGINATGFGNGGGGCDRTGGTKYGGLGTVGIVIVEW